MYQGRPVCGEEVMNEARGSCEREEESEGDQVRVGTQGEIATDQVHKLVTQPSSAPLFSAALV